MLKQHLYSNFCLYRIARPSETYESAISSSRRMRDAE